MRFHPSQEAAYGAACADVTEILRHGGADDETAQTLAGDIVNALVRDGWQYRWREPAPPIRSTARPGPPPDFVRQAREDLHRELERINAEWEAQAHNPTPDPTPAGEPA